MYKKMLQIARENVAQNPRVGSVEDYLQGIKDEVEEARSELGARNHIHLQDELSDIMWDYMNVLALCERDGLIENVEEVLLHGEKKYSERLSAMIEGSSTKWNEIKERQKTELKHKHKEHYGKDEA